MSTTTDAAAVTIEPFDRQLKILSPPKNASQIRKLVYLICIVTRSNNFFLLL